MQLTNWSYAEKNLLQVCMGKKYKKESFKADY